MLTTVLEDVIHRSSVLHISRFGVSIALLCLRYTLFDMINHLFILFLIINISSNYSPIVKHKITSIFLFERN